MTTKKPQNDMVLAIRINKDLLDQLNALSKTKSIGASSLVRMLIADYIRDEAPKALLGTAKPTKPLNLLDQQRQALSPAERAKQDADYDEAWG